jgi:amidase
MYRVSKETMVYTMSPNNLPVMRVESGSTLVFETCDCFEDQIKTVDTPFNELDWNRINPATGPVFVKGAEPGDALCVKIQSIKVGDQGVMVTGPDMGVIGDELEENSIRIVPIKNNRAIFSEKIELKLNPMVGVIGTAPARESIPCGEPGRHGGNMDCKVITEDASVYLPVNVPGALLAMGDLHAVMGDGEVSVCGVEVPGEVTVTVEVIKGHDLPLPMVTTEEAVYTIASEMSLDEAAQSAVRGMVKILEGYGLSKDEAIRLMSAGGDLQICQVVDPKKTARFRMSRSILKALGAPGNGMDI